LRLPTGVYDKLYSSPLTFDQKNKRVKLERTLPKATDQNVKGPSSEGNEYAGSYGARSISFENGAMFLQRQGGSKLKLVQVTKNEFTLEARTRAISSTRCSLVSLVNPV
jgi:hypothetical protein